MDDFVPGVVAEIKQDTESPFRNTSGAIPPAATPLPPNWRPSPLSLRDISPHCGESPFTNHNKKTLEFYYKEQKEKELCKDLLQTKEQVSDTNSSEITIIPA